MANRHKSKAKVYAGATSNVLEEAKEKKSGGAVTKNKRHKVEDSGKAKERLDKFKRGGRAMGKRSGSDKMPLSSASSISLSPAAK